MPTFQKLKIKHENKQTQGGGGTLLIKIKHAMQHQLKTYDAIGSKYSDDVKKYKIYYKRCMKPTRIKQELSKRNNGIGIDDTTELNIHLKMH